jgi:hypothetical protein
MIINNNIKERNIYIFYKMKRKGGEMYRLSKYQIKKREEKKKIKKQLRID